MSIGREARQKNLGVEECKLVTKAVSNYLLVQYRRRVCDMWGCKHGIH